MLSRALLAVLILTGCGSRGEDPSAEERGSADAAAALTVPAAAGEDPALLEVRARTALESVLRDAARARLSNVRSGLGGSICGEVDPRKANGGYAARRHFLVGRDGVAVLSAGPRIEFGEPDDPFPDLYIQWCASTDELQRLGPQIAIRRGTREEPVAELPPISVGGGEAGATAQNDPAQPAPGTADRRETAAPGKDPDSETFSDAVLRPKQDRPSGK